MNEQQLTKANDNSFKLILIGSSKVGKSSIILRFNSQPFSEPYIETLGVDFRLKTIDNDGKTIKLFLWEISGKQLPSFNSMTYNCLRGAHGILFIYDITSLESFEYIKECIKEIGDSVDKETVKILVGNKCDLNPQRVIKNESAFKFASEIQIRFCEVSAKQAVGIDDVFITLLTDVRKRIEKFYMIKK